MHPHVRLRWTSHEGSVMSMLEALLSTDSLVDVTLACDGQYLRAHKVVLSACSSYFQELFTFEVKGNKNTIVFMKDVKYSELKALIQFMYRGEVNIPQSELHSFLAVAQALRIRGLADMEESSADTNTNYRSDMVISPNSASPYQHLSDVINHPQDVNLSTVVQNSINPTRSESHIIEPSVKRTKRNASPASSTKRSPKKKRMRKFKMLTSTWSHSNIKKEIDPVAEITHDDPVGTATDPLATETDSYLIQTQDEEDLQITDVIHNADNHTQMMPLQYIETQKGKPALLLNGFIYQKYQQKRNNTYWRCDQYSRTSRCPARCVTKEDVLKSESGQHNHLPDAAAVELEK